MAASHALHMFKMDLPENPTKVQLSKLASLESRYKEVYEKERKARGKLRPLYYKAKALYKEEESQISKSGSST